MIFELEKHLATYRAQVKAEGLVAEFSSGRMDYIEYARHKPTADPARYPKTYDYLAMAMDNVIKAVRTQNERDYVTWLPRHQEAMICLFEEMVSEDLWGYSSDDQARILRMLEGRGWQWFKFCRQPLRYQKVFEGKTIDLIFIPRYAPPYIDLCNYKATAVFDANEISLLSLDPRPEVIAFKLKNPRSKIFSLQVSEQTGEVKVALAKQICEINTRSALDDWALRII